MWNKKLSLRYAVLLYVVVVVVGYTLLQVSMGLLF